MSSETHKRDIEWVRADYARVTGMPFQHFHCPMLMRDEPAALMLGHVVNEKFKDVPEYKIVQRGDIDGWYGSRFEADLLTLDRYQDKNIGDLLSTGKSPPRGLKPVIVAGEEEVGFYHLKDGEAPFTEHSLMELNTVNGPFMRLAIKKSRAEMLALLTRKWHSEAFGDFRIAALVSLIKAAYLTLFWKLGYRYALSSAGLAVGYEILGRFYRENREKTVPETQRAAVEFFKPYINMVRPVDQVQGTAPRGTIEDNRVLIWLGSSGRGLGIGVFVRTNDRLHCVLMPGYYQYPEGVAEYQDFLRNDKDELWVREGQFDEANDCWYAHPQRIRAVWPKDSDSFDLSRTPKEILTDLSSSPKEQGK